MPIDLVRRQFSGGADARAAEQGVVRAAALLGVTPLLRERGIDPAQVMASIGLHPRTLDDAENRIPYSSVGLLLERCAETTGCHHFGLLAGQHTNLASLGLLGELMWRSPSVQAALRCLILHLHLQTRGAVVTQGVAGGSATFGFEIYQRNMPGAAQAYDRVMAHEFNIMRALCGSQWFPDEVTFAHAKPRDVRPYRQFFHCTLRFDADRTEIVFRKSWLEHAPPGADVELHRALQSQIAMQEMLRPDDCAEHIRRVLRTMVVNGTASETQVARLLSIPSRSLRRQLTAQGTTFRELLDEVRYEVSRQLLVDTDMTTAEVAESLAYADASAFTRAFRRWTQSPPAAWRARMRSA
jgi:AraC-like DNA-binding protein